MKFSKGEIICREDLAYPEGALVCDGYDAAGRLLAHPLGGGFQLTVPAQDEPRFRVVAAGEKGAALFHRGRFTLADGETLFEGGANGELWNGWEMPRFEAGVARVVALCLHHGVTGLWTADRDFSAFPTLKTRNPLVGGGESN